MANHRAANSSNITEFTDRATIKQEAGAWIAKIDQGQLSQQQIAELQQWAATSSFHRSYLQQLGHNWDSMGILQELAELFPMQPATPMPASQPIMPAQAGIAATVKTQLTQLLQRLQQPKAWAPTLAALALVAVFIGSHSPNHFETDIGQQASYALPDGTQITLNTNSELRVDYNSDRRHIYLLRGEAHFDVAKNPQRPFMVYAGEGMVWAVGTAFNVRYLSAGSPSNQSIDVTVTEGTVKVFADIEPDKNPSPALKGPQSPPANQEKIVHAGKSVQYNKVIKATQTPLPPVLEQKLAWQQGALIFKGETLEQALQEIARYTDKTLVISDPSIKDIRVGGHYKTDDIHGLLASISKSLDLKLEQTGSQLRLSAIE